MDLQVTHEWATPLGLVNINLAEQIRRVLISLIIKQGVFVTERPYNETNNSELHNIKDKIYNLFDYSSKVLEDIEKECLKEFEKIISKVLRTYVNKAWEMNEDVEIRIRGFGNVQNTFGKRTAPHFHNGWDGTLVHYLTVGEEFFLDNVSTYPPINTDDSGNLILLDPRPAIRMPHNKKAQTFKPVVGMTLIHPGYVWHETQMHTKAGIRIVFVINFNIHNKNDNELPRNLAFYNLEDLSVLV